MTPSTLQVKAAATSDHGSNQQLAPILNPSNFQVKAPASIGQSAHLVNPVNTNGIVMTPSTLQVKAAASSDHGSNQQLNSILKPSSFQARYEQSPSEYNGNNQQPRSDTLQFEKDQRYALRWICINAD
jgi:predicted ABC-type transport system involved in lysophospholipase L1 biosynthesis ATPase subunit